MQTGTIRKIACGFLFAFHSNYDSILQQFRDKHRYWSKIVIFSYPLLFGAPLGGSRRNIAILFNMEKLEWWGYPMVEKLRICIIVYTQYRRVTDGQTDVLPRHSPRYEYASRGNKIKK